MDRMAWMDNEFDIDLAAQDINAVDITVNPNPVNDILTFSGASFDNSYTVIVYDLAGQIKDVEVNKSSKTINVSDLNSGMYLIQISNDNNQTTKRFIKI